MQRKYTAVSCSILTVIGWPMGEYIIAMFKNIPAERIETAMGFFAFLDFGVR
jgi:hypothetical protein